MGTVNKKGQDQKPVQKQDTKQDDKSKKKKPRKRDRLYGSGSVRVTMSDDAQRFWD